MAGIPLPKGSELLARIENLTPETIQNEFLLNGIRRDIRNLAKVEPFQAFVVQGMLAFREGDYDLGRAEFERAFRLNSHDSVSLHNYAVSLGESGYISESLEWHRKILGSFPDDPSCFDAAIATCIAALRGQEALGYVDIWEKMHTDRKPHPDRFFAEAIVDIQQDHNVTDDDCENLTVIMFSICTVHKLHFYARARMDVVREQKILNYQRSLDLPIDEITDLNVELCTKLAESDLPPRLTEGFIVSFGKGEG